MERTTTEIQMDGCEQALLADLSNCARGRKLSVGVHVLHLVLSELHWFQGIFFGAWVFKGNGPIGPRGRMSRLQQAVLKELQSEGCRQGIRDGVLDVGASFPATSLDPAHVRRTLIAP